MLSHRSAAAHWGLLGTDHAMVDVAAPATRHGRPGIRVHLRFTWRTNDHTIVRRLGALLH